MNQTTFTERSIVLPDRLRDEETGIPMIPSISDEEIVRLYKRLKPVITIDEIKYLLKEYTLDQIKNTSYLFNAEEGKTVALDSSRLKTVDEFPCLHTYGYYGFFKPSIKEILAQIPNGLEYEASLFEIVEEPKSYEDIFRYPEIVNNGFHLSKVRAYKQK